MMGASRIVAACLAGLLAGCQGEQSTPVTGGPGQAAPTSTLAGSDVRPLEGAEPFRCPSAGTEVAYDVGMRIAYQGSIPDYVDVCAFIIDGRPISQLLAFYNWPFRAPAGEQAIRAAYATFWPVRQGSAITFSFMGRAGETGPDVRFTETWQVHGTERIQVGTLQRDALVLSRRQEGSLGNTHLSTRTYWLDRETRAILRLRAVVERGTVPSRNLNATSLTVPPRP